MDQLPPTPLAAASIAADTVYPGMYRVRFADDSLSGMLNLSRAKQALRSVLAGRPGPAWARPPIADPADAVVLVIVPSAQHRDGHSAGARGAVFDALPVAFSRNGPRRPFLTLPAS